MENVNDIKISKLSHQAEAEECARIMADTDPWVTLHRTYDDCLKMLNDSSREIYVATHAGALLGFVILNMKGSFIGYIQTLCVAPESRGQGLGSILIEFAEERILNDSPNIFMCVSSFNKDAQRLYERLGYEVVGELKDYIVRGYSEILMRKSIAPLAEFKKK